jgi:hypothetical protein
MLDDNVSSLDVTGVTKPLRECLDKQLIAGEYAEDSYPWNLPRRLPLGGERRSEDGQGHAGDKGSAVHHSIT